MCCETRWPRSAARCTRRSVAPGRSSRVLWVRGAVTWKTLHPSCTAGRASEPRASDAEREPKRLDREPGDLAASDPELSGRVADGADRSGDLVAEGAHQLGGGLGQHLLG